MQKILLMGAGKIGALIAFLLTSSHDYFVYLADSTKDNPQAARLNKRSNLEYVQLDAQNSQTVQAFLQKNSVGTVVSSLPYYLNVQVAQVAATLNLNYFDLTEDINTTSAAIELAKKVESAFVPQCGLAPGFISVIANEIMKKFQKLECVKLRVGALPVNTSNALQYSLTWSTDGLINEYGNPCYAIENGEEKTLFPLENLEEIKIDGLTYEAFNTSGGIGSLVKSYLGKVKTLTYKTVRYPGHCEKMRFLMNDLQLNEDRATLKRILENTLPKTAQDVVLVYVSVTGMREGHFFEENYVKKFYPKTIEGQHWSAIQLTTASELCAVLDIVLTHPKKYRGLIKQEQFTLDEIITNRFGQYYR